MSGWIKMGVGLRRNPKVVRIASALKADRLRVIGALHAVWCVFDEHGDGGLLACYTLAIMDDEIGWRGFSAAMQAIGWLVETDSGLLAPDYEEHNGPAAKRRALDAQSKGKRRQSSSQQTTSVRTESGQMSASDADELPNREEKRREEKSKDPPASRVPPAAAGPKPSKRCPESFAVTPELRAWAQTEIPGVDIDFETGAFRDWTFATARVDWPATWRGWMRKASKDGRVAKRPETTGETAWQRSQRELVEKATGGMVSRKPSNHLETANHVAPLALG